MLINVSLDISRVRIYNHYSNLYRQQNDASHSRDDAEEDQRGQIIKFEPDLNYGRQEGSD